MTALLNLVIRSRFHPPGDFFQATALWAELVLSFLFSTRQQVRENRRASRELRRVCRDTGRETPFSFLPQTVLTIKEVSCPETLCARTCWFVYVPVCYVHVYVGAATAAVFFLTLGRVERRRAAAVTVCTAERLLPGRRVPVPAHPTLHGAALSAVHRHIMSFTC